jgi:hypothetical protein
MKTYLTEDVYDQGAMMELLVQKPWTGTIKTKGSPGGRADPYAIWVS